MFIIIYYISLSNTFSISLAVIHIKCILRTLLNHVFAYGYQYPRDTCNYNKFEITTNVILHIHRVIMEFVFVRIIAVTVYNLILHDRVLIDKRGSKIPAPTRTYYYKL